MYLPLEPFDELKWFRFSRTRLSCINHPCAFTVGPVNAHMSAVPPSCRLHFLSALERVNLERGAEELGILNS